MAPSSARRAADGAREGWDVAQERSLTAQEVERLRAAGIVHPGLVYFEDRQRVAEALSAKAEMSKR